jgi:hypothetical protein
MAFYDVNAAIQKPNMLAMVQQGMAFGTQQRQLREQEQERMTLRDLTAGAIGGDFAKQDQIAAIDPQRAGQVQDLAANRGRAFAGWVGQMKQARESGDPRRVNAIYKMGVPLLSSISGQPAPPEWTPELDADFVNLEAMAAMQGQDAQEQEPAGYRQAHLTAIAAGYQPGSEEYKQAMRIAARTEAPAVPAGYTPRTYRDEFGREVMELVQNRGEGAGQVIMPGGGQQAPQQAPQPNLAASGGDPQMDALTQAANAMIKAGIPPEQVDAFLMQTAQASPNVQVNPPAMAPTANPAPLPPSANMVGGGPIAPLGGSGRGQTDSDRARAAADQAAQVEAAKLGTQQQFAPRQAELDAQREGAVITARTTAESRAEKLTALPQVIAKTDQTIALINKALNHPGRGAATGMSGALGGGMVPGTAGRDFMAILDQLKGQAFLEAFQALKGGGAITQVEGQKAEQAIARLDAAQSDEAFVEALTELSGLAEIAKQRAIKQAAGAPSEEPSEPGDDDLIGKYL